MPTMQAIRAHSRGGAENLHLESAPVPEPQDDEVLIAVHATAITYDELLWDESWTRNGIDRTPIIPSHEVSGTVAGIGAAVFDLAVGDDVYGLIEFDRDGAAAQYVTVPAADLARKPASIDHVQSAALPLAALTAWQALVDHAKLVVGESVLVTGGAGGVGAYVVQLAHHFGAQVSATISNGDADEYVWELGADEVFVLEALGTFDVVIDTVGGAALAAAYSHLRDGGRLITLSAPPAPELKQGRNVRDEFFVVRPNRAQLEKIAALVDAGTLKSLVGETFPLAETATAYADRGRHGGPGKTVLIVR
ncbi:NADPH:quinone reductase-like Zn-dependent oxidoreductase [Jatrophihabitans sp. GAS493]|nr:NADP-dependent oxidoreductase [Jatrophihabitans sp. GAS493]SOD74952.1 NADPH:quinone reductase-like Zn-dependent oxidoreductase [Jatrophihabitans sp. GAS493]